MFKPIAAVMVLFAFVCPQAEAKVYLFLTNQTNETSFYLTETPVKLNDAGITTDTFRLRSPTRVLITYSAECRTGSTGANASVKVLIDGVGVRPTGADHGVSFCNFDFYGTYSITVSKQLTAGTHRIRIIGFSNAANLGYLKKSSLQVFD